MNEVSKMKKEELLQYVQQLQQAAAAAQAAQAAAEQRAEQAEALAAAKKRAPAAPKTHAELLGIDPSYLAGAIWAHVQHLALSATEEGILNALVAHALKGGKLMSAGASRQNLSRARRAVAGYLAEREQRQAEAIVFDCLYCVPCMTVTPEGDYKGYSQVLNTSPRLLAEGLQAAETKLAAATTDKDKAAATTDKDKAKAALVAAEKEFTSWMAKQKAAIATAEANAKAENA